jgi:hypothetical protein
MAQELLVDDQIYDGQKIIDQFLADGLDVAVAFWAESNEGLWRLYIASPRFDDKKPGEAARTVYESVSKVPDLTIEPALDIRLINDRNPIAQDAVKIAGRQGKEEGIRYRGTRLGDLAIEDAYIYPRPAVPLRQSFTISYVRQGNSNEWLATTRKGELYRMVRPKGVVSYSTALYEGEKPEDQRFALIHVLVEIDPSLDERTIAANPIILSHLVEQAQSLADGMFRRRHPEATIHHHDTALAPV